MLFHFYQFQQLAAKTEKVLQKVYRSVKTITASISQTAYHSLKQIFLKHNLKQLQEIHQNLEEITRKTILFMLMLQMLHLMKNIPINSKLNINLRATTDLPPSH